MINKSAQEWFSKFMFIVVIIILILLAIAWVKGL